MSEVITVRCDADGCGAVKAAANKWFKVVTCTRAALIVKADEWEAGCWMPEALAKGSHKTHDACGLPHAQKIVEGVLGGIDASNFNRVGRG